MNSYSRPGFSHSLMLSPKSLVCFDFLENTVRRRKMVCLVPHVIKFREEADIVTWRCNWGMVCQTRCPYAMSKDRTSMRGVTESSDTPGSNG